MRAVITQISLDIPSLSNVYNMEVYEAFFWYNNLREGLKELNNDN